MIGQVLNHRYEILEKIGEGGMAIAYRGRDRVLGRVVAVKVMRPELAADAEFLNRFRREARAAAGIAHEHIAGIYDTGTDGAHHYIVMEYVEGESLRDRLRREGPLPLDEALRIATETAEALQAAHAAGVVHRDIKPHNILLGREGQVKVTDFGVARALAASSQTETGRIIGSVNYLSPEQARGDATGPQADLYSLGATLFEMLTGRTPFDSSDRMAVLHKHIYDPPPRVSDFRPGLPPEVDLLVEHCLQKDQALRFASARELLSYLAACPRDEASGWRVSLGSRSLLGRTSRRLDNLGWRLRARLLWMVSAFALVLLAGSGYGLWVLLQPAPPPRVPDVVGMRAVAARATVETLGYDYRELGQKASEDVMEGAVLSQDPRPRVQAPKGTVVKVVISTGNDKVVVPDIADMAIGQARLNLERERLTWGKIHELYHEKVPKGYVIATLPKAGTRVLTGTSVDVEVSRGPEPGEVTPPPPPPLPPTPEGPTTGQPGKQAKQQQIAYLVSKAVVGSRSRVKVTIELTDDRGQRRVIYEAYHQAEDLVPTQTFTVSSPSTLRIYVDGTVMVEKQCLP